MTTAVHDMRRSAAEANRSVMGGGLVMPGTLLLQVTSGAHAGAEFPIRKDSLSIGSALDNDVVLFASDIAAHHLRIDVTGRLRGRVQVLAMDQPVLVDGRHWVEVGHSYAGRAPMVLNAGGTDVKIHAPSDWTGPLKLVAALLLLGLLLFVGLPMLQRMVTPALTQFGRSSLIAAPVPPEVNGSMLAALQTRLAQAGLGGLVAVSEGKGGSIVASGTVDDGRAQQWRDIVKWYDAQPKAPLLVNTVMRSNAIAGPQGVRSIWIDGSPQILLSNGQSAGKGDTIPGGWKVESIDANGVVLTRDGLSQKITF